MIYDQSYGIVPLRKKEESGSFDVFLIQHRKGHWAMPKGHPEGSENPIETAKRELFEETGLEVERILFDAPLIEKYQFRNGQTMIYKTVSYFVALVKGQEKLQRSELKDGEWLSFDAALQKATFAEARSILTQVKDLLDK